MGDYEPIMRSLQHRDLQQETSVSIKFKNALEEKQIALRKKYPFVTFYIQPGDKIIQVSRIGVGVTIRQPPFCGFKTTEDSQAPNDQHYSGGAPHCI